MEKRCSDLQARYFEQSVEKERADTLKRMEWPCRIKTWFGHKYRRTMKLFSKIKVGDYVYTTDKNPYVGIVTGIHDKMVDIKNQKGTVITIPKTQVKKMTFEQAKYVGLDLVEPKIGDYDIDLVRSAPLVEPVIGDYVFNKQDPTQKGQVVALESEHTYFKRNDGRLFKTAKNNIEKIPDIKGMTKTYTMASSIKPGDYVFDKTSENHGKVLWANNDQYYVKTDYKFVVILKKNAQKATTANLGGRRNAPSNRRFRTNGRRK